jgi:NTE family protein
MKRYTLCLLFFVLCFCSVAQKQRAKIGLTLSGGGAKGLAHIGLLKVLDSAGIHVDYITGTSMGAVLGGLYSIGYTGNDLEAIARNADWELLISNNTPLDEVNIEEKDEFGRYLAELPIINWKPSLPLGAIEGQELTKLLGDLTFPVHGITSFDSLPIPFHCIGADIITGEAVTIKHGYLPTAMRASMAIPSVFTPVKLDGRLLVDGGLINNFPVRHVKEMGADIVIGGYTGGRLYNEEQLNSAVKLIYQSASFVRIADSKEQMELTHLLADYDLELQEYSSASFNDVDSIINIGYRIAKKLYPELKHLADSLELKHGFYYHPLQRTPEYKICISDVKIEGASAKTLPLIKGKLNLKAGETYSVADINEIIDAIYGTRFFDKVYYTLQMTPYGNEITIHVKESLKAVFKFGLHYDNEQAAGILVNITLRNIFGRGSRLVGTFDIAEYPKIRINYQRFINKKQNLWVHGGYHYQFVPYRLYNFGRLREELTNGFSDFHLSLNKTINRSSYFGITLNRELNLTRTRINPEDKANPDTFEFRRLQSRENGIALNYVANTLNSFLFPTNGSRTFATVKYIPNHYYNINYYTGGSSLGGLFLTTDTFVTPAVKISLAHTEIVPLHKNISWVNNFFGGIIIDDFLKGDEPFSQGAIPSHFFIGGVEQRQRSNTIPFIGYRETELTAAQAVVYTTSMQMELWDKFFFTPSISVQASGIGYRDFLKNITNFNFNYQDFSTGANHSFGYGITFAYNWFGGPISLTLYRSSRIEDIRGYFTYGYKF